MKINHKNINESSLIEQLQAQGVVVTSLIVPSMRTAIIDGVEQEPVAVDGNIEFEGDAAVVQAIIDAHDPESIELEREAKEAERIAALLEKHPEALKKIEDKLAEKFEKKK